MVYLLSSIVYTKTNMATQAAFSSKRQNDLKITFTSWKTVSFFLRTSFILLNPLDVSRSKYEVLRPTWSWAISPLVIGPVPVQRLSTLKKKPLNQMWRITLFDLCWTGSIEVYMSSCASVRDARYTGLPSLTSSSLEHIYRAKNIKVCSHLTFFSPFFPPF